EAPVVDAIVDIGRPLRVGVALQGFILGIDDAVAVGVLDADLAGPRAVHPCFRRIRNLSDTQLPVVVPDTALRIARESSVPVQRIRLAAGVDRLTDEPAVVGVAPRRLLRAERGVRVEGESGDL